MYVLMVLFGNSQELVHSKGNADNSSVDTANGGTGVSRNLNWFSDVLNETMQYSVSVSTLVIWPVIDSTPS